MTDALSTALETLLARYASLVERAGARHGLTRAEVDEVLQDVRVRLWRSRKTSESIRVTPGSYVYRTAVSAAITLIERRRSAPGPVVDLGPESVVAGGPMAEPRESLERSELRAQLERALASLGATRRPVVRMYLAGYNHVEIAAVLRWSEPKVRNLLYRGLTDLRARLTEAGVSPGGTG